MARTQTPEETTTLVSRVLAVARRDSHTSWAATYLTCCALAFVAIAAYVLLQDRGPLYDEPVHLARAKALAGSSSISEWLNSNTTSSPGPTYAVMHYALSGGSGALSVPWLRIPNLVLLLVIVTLAALHLRDLGTSSAVAAAASIAAVPMTWVLSGLALTEIPAIGGIALAVYAAHRLAVEKSVKGHPRLLAGLALAVGIAVAVCGRQTYLPAVAALVWLASSSKRATFIALASVVVGLVPAMTIFWIWKGLVPPGLVKEIHAERGLVPLHAVLAFGYAGVAALLIAPRFYLQGRKQTATILAAGLVSAAVFGGTFAPFGSAKTLFGGVLAGLLTHVGSRIIPAVGGAFAAAVALEVFRRRAERPLVAHGTGLALVCGVCAALPFAFSSRYVGMCLPFLVPLLAGHIVFGPWAVGRLLVGVSAGAVALRGYFMGN
jgi:hypothetical protein